MRVISCHGDATFLSLVCFLIGIPSSRSNCKRTVYAVVNRSTAVLGNPTGDARSTLGHLEWLRVVNCSASVTLAHGAASERTGGTGAHK